VDRSILAPDEHGKKQAKKWVLLWARKAGL
jgi:hypothetical protein